MLVFILILIFCVLPIIVGIYQLALFIQYLRFWDEINPKLKKYFSVYGILLILLFTYPLIQEYYKFQLNYLLLLILSGFTLGLYFFFLSDTQKQYDENQKKTLTTKSS